MLVLLYRNYDKPWEQLFVRVRGFYRKYDVLEGETVHACTVIVQELLRSL